MFNVPNVFVLSYPAPYLNSMDKGTVQTIQRMAKYDLLVESASDKSIQLKKIEDWALANEIKFRIKQGKPSYDEKTKIISVYTDLIFEKEEDAALFKLRWL